MHPVRVPSARVPELRAAVRAFAEAPSPARFARVRHLLEAEPPRRRPR
jgi:hypothetical protein